ncbi:DUF4169 family protein [Paracoccus jiaweipingae]|uniref:DUF4169 family protein n=1 Tax=unclassified Paracoccus (in: a-proteobacteria) TaxID=2688777 RepID=UPI0037B35765
MTQITNLTRFRKQKARTDKRRKGDENAARFGLGRAQKQLQEKTAEQARHHLDQHRRDDD